jgi:hypothetical protein
MTPSDRRKHPRCSQATAVFYHFLNKLQRHEALVRNYSRFGMYLETDHALAPGTIIVIRSKSCGAGGDPEFEPAYCSINRAVSDACQELKTQVMAEVKRCEALKEGTVPLFGIALRYISPAT